MKIIISFFILGLSFGSGPCLASCGPVLISYLAGTKKDIPRSIIAYILFSLPRMAIYSALAVLIFFFGRFSAERLLGNFYQYILIFAGSFIALLGILMVLGRKLEFSWCRFLEKHILEKDKKSMVIIGLSMGLLPCAPLLATFSYIGLISKSWLQSLYYSLAFGIGTFFSPLILLAVFTGLLPRLLGRSALFGRIFAFLCGLIMVFLGVNLIKRAF